MVKLFAACPPVYTLPGTWDDPEKIKRCQETLIPHLELEPETGFLVFVALLVFGLIIYGLYKTFGKGGEGLRDEIKEHARMHELGIAHGHEGRATVMTQKAQEQDYPQHRHSEGKITRK